MKRIYFDYAASTPVRPEVARVMTPYFSRVFGNPSSLHREGQEGIAAVDRARELVAHAVGASFREIIFTGSATEANNLALRGAVMRAKKEIKKPRIIVSAIEHESVLETARDLAREGVEVITIPVDQRGVIDVARLARELNERTVLVSVMYVNNEIGTIEPIREIAKIIAHQRGKGMYPLFHTDAVQAFNYHECDVRELGVDMMTISGHKIGGPKGVGVLFVKRDEARMPHPYPIVARMTGGGQEFGLRSGTENVPAIVGFAEAVQLVIKERNKERARILSLKKYFWKQYKHIFPEASIYGVGEKEFALASPHILNIALPHTSLDDMLVRLDITGIAASSGSACASRASTHSHVLSALFAHTSRGIRFSFGRSTTKADIDEAMRRMRTFSAH